MNIAVNARFRHQPLTGVQRYATEISARLQHGLRMVTPVSPDCHGFAGHLWEQFVLPTRVREELLWSPGNTGPLLKTRQVVTVHDLATFDHPEWFNPRFSGFYRWLLPKLLPRVRSVICVSAFTRSRLLQLIPLDPARVVVSHPGVSRNFSRPSPEQIQRQLAEFSLTPGYLLCLASSEPRKNQRRLLDAWAGLGTRFGVTLVLAGHAERRQIFGESTLSTDPSVRSLGFVDESSLSALYSGAAAFVFPSLYEGFGFPPLEAMACETPVIASQHPALREVLGDAAAYCDAFDTASIAEAIARVLGSQPLRQELAGKGSERVRLFDWDRAAAETRDVLTRAA